MGVVLVGNMTHGMDKKVFLYVGLSKTGSAFLRQEVFIKLDPSRVCVNPEGVTRAFQEMHAAHYSSACKNSVEKIVVEAFSHITQDIVLITDTSLAGDPEDNFRQFDKITDFLVKLFPNASIIITLRNQVDWLLSLYKHLTPGLEVSVAKFLNFSNGKFHPKNEENFPNVDALGFDFAEKCDRYVRMFGRENVHILFHEDLVTDPENFVRRVGGIFGCDVVGDVHFRTENRSFSTLAIQLTLYKEKLRALMVRDKSRLHQKGWLLRVIQWLGKYDLGEELWQNVIRKKGVLYAPAMLLRRFLLKLRWDYFIRHGLDRIAYFDWDLLGKRKRALLSRHYSRLNEGLRPYFRGQETESHYITAAWAESQANGSDADGSASR
jgi:hypothetical protein